MTKKQQQILIQKLFKEYPPKPAFLWHALSFINRYAGKTKKPLNVFNHSNRVFHTMLHAAKKTPNYVLRAALFHDAAEVYISDIPSPVKKMFPDLVEFEKTLLKAIFTYNDWQWPTKTEWAFIKKYDKLDLEYEKPYLSTKFALRRLNDTKKSIKRT